jgi:MoxR-like ATPase
MQVDEALEAVLLELLVEYQVSVPELGTYRARHDPFVVLTSNNTRDLSAALKRRCLHLSLDYPNAERELAIIRSKDTGLPDALTRALIDIVRGLRDLDLRKAPSISETIDWARTRTVLGASELTADLLAQDYYGSPGTGRRPPAVGKSQGERSFNARGARRRPV